MKDNGTISTECHSSNEVIFQKFKFYIECMDKWQNCHIMIYDIYSINFQVLSTHSLEKTNQCSTHIQISSKNTVY